MKTLLLALLIISFLPARSTPSDSIPRKQYFTKHLESPITFDGIPDEQSWNDVEWGGDFIQWQPNEGMPHTFSFSLP